MSQPRKPSKSDKIDRMARELMHLAATSFIVVLDEHDRANVAIKGDGPDIVSLLVYQAISETNPEKADDFANILINAVCVASVQDDKFFIKLDEAFDITKKFRIDCHESKTR